MGVGVGCGCVLCGTQARTIIKAMNLHGGVVSVRHREYLAQFGDAAHFGGAWLNEVDRLRFKQMLEIHQDRKITRLNSCYTCIPPAPLFLSKNIPRPHPPLERLPLL